MSNFKVNFYLSYKYEKCSEFIELNCNFKILKVPNCNVTLLNKLQQKTLNLYTILYEKFMVIPNKYVYID